MSERIEWLQLSSPADVSPLHQITMLRLQFILLSMASMFVSAPASAQTIVNLPDGPVTPSGRIRIQGSQFGTGGSVEINGSQALTTTWRDDEVHAYVPESVQPGTAQVQVLSSSGSSNLVSFSVVPRQPSGRVQWRFAVTSVTPNLHGPAVGMDGTLYLDDSDGRLFAVASSGELLWIYEGNDGVVGGGHEGPVDVGADGTIYYATNPLGPEIRVHAVNPDGTRKWMFSELSLSFRIIAGPNVGPDGNLYMAFDRAHLGTLGACSLDSNGVLRWSSTGTPPINDTGSLGHRIAFGQSSFYVAFNEGNVPGVNHNYLFGFDYNGSQSFAVPGAWSTGRPHARADGSFILRWGLNTLLRSFDPTGNEQWTFLTGGNLTEPAVGPGGVTYIQVGSGGPKLHAISANGTINWTVQGQQLGWMNFLGVSPQGGHLLDGGRAGFGMPGWIRSYSTADGSLEWSVDLPEEDPGSGPADLVVQSDWAFNADASRGYSMVNALVLNTADAYGYLYAVSLDAASSSDICTGDGGNQMGCTTCPCSNNASPGTIGGCLNSAGTSARLTATGNPSVSLPANTSTDLRFGLSGAPPLAFSILNSGDGVAPGNMTNPCFGMSSGTQATALDGLRCAIMNTRRHGGRSSDASGDVGGTNDPWGGEGNPMVGLASAGTGFLAGQTRYFQVIHRDDPLLGCMRGLNTSQAVEVTFTP